MGAARGRPGGAPLAWAWGVWGQVLSHPRPLVLWGVGPGPATHWLWVRRLRASGTHHKPHSARSGELALRAVRAARGRPGGAPLAWVWGVRGQALSHTGPLVLRGVQPWPTTHWLCCGCGGCGRGDPSTTPLCALLRAGFTRCGGGKRLAEGGTSCLGVGRPGLGAFLSPTARLLGRAAGAHHPLAVGAGGAGVGTRHQPHRARSCVLASRTVGVAGGCLAGHLLPWRGTSGVGRSFTPDRSSFGACGRDPPDTGCICGGCGAWGPVTNPTARALASWLCALWGWHEGSRGGAPFASVWGVRDRAFRQPRPPVIWGVRPGAHYPLAVSARNAGVGTRHQTHSARPGELSLFFALSGRHKGAQGGRSLPGSGVSEVGRSPTPDRPSFRACGRGPLPTGCGCRGCGRGDPSPTPQRALLRAGFARCGDGTGSPRGGTSCLGVGRTEFGALPPPTARPLARAAGAHYPLAVVKGGAGMETHHGPHSARSCELALRAVGAAGGRPGGTPLAWVWGVWGRALSHPRPLVLLGVRPGPTTNWLWVRGVWVWGLVTNPTARALARWLCALWGRHEGARGGGASCLGVWRPGSDALPPPTARPSWRAARAHYPLAVGAGGVGETTRHPPHSASSCELALRAVRAA